MEIFNPEEPNKQEKYRENKLQPVSELIPGLDTESLRDVTQIKDPEEVIRKNRETLSKTTEYDTETSHIVHVVTPIRYTKDEIEKFDEHPSRIEDMLEKRKTLEKALENIKGEIVIDLGAGITDSGYVLADEASADSYVAVEPIFFKMLQRSIEGAIKEKDRDTPFTIVPEDMLSFLKRLPDNKVSFILSGIADILKEEYWEKVKKEIERTLSKEGAILATRHYIEFPKEKIKLVESEWGGLRVFKKTTEKDE